MTNVNKERKRYKEQWCCLCHYFWRIPGMTNHITSRTTRSPMTNVNKERKRYKKEWWCFCHYFWRIPGMTKHITSRTTKSPSKSQRRDPSKHHKVQARVSYALSAAYTTAM